MSSLILEKNSDIIETKKIFNGSSASVTPIRAESETETFFAATSDSCSELTTNKMILNRCSLEKNDKLNQ